MFADGWRQYADFWRDIDLRPQFGRTAFGDRKKIDELFFRSAFRAFRNIWRDGNRRAGHLIFETAVFAILQFFVKLND